MLTIDNLTVSIGGKEILHEISLHVSAGETVVLFGPNGSGKTTLLMSILGFSNYTIESGSMIYNDRDITHLTVNERAKLGIGLMFQRPPTVKGVRVRDLTQMCGTEQTDVAALARELSVESFLDRFVNDGFSGGEIKRSELLQLMAQGPELVLLDEPESGVDLESISLVGRAVNIILEKEIKHYTNGRSMKAHRCERHHSALVITHTGYILDYIRVDRGIVMLDGRVVCNGNPYEMLDCIRTMGYQECIRCATKDQKN